MTLFNGNIKTLTLPMSKYYNFWENNILRKHLGTYVNLSN